MPPLRFITLCIKVRNWWGQTPKLTFQEKKNTPLNRSTELMTNSPLDRGELKNADTSALEKQIDKMVYALYGLTPEEIAIVEGR